jgi:hypothetical protein
MSCKADDDHEGQDSYNFGSIHLQGYSWPLLPYLMILQLHGLYSSQ